MIRRGATTAIALLSLIATVPTAHVTAQPSIETRSTGSVTFHKDVEPILQKYCQTCHRPGEIGPMSLMTFEAARPWARSIKSQVLARAMPPWYTEPTIGHFRNQRTLAQRDIDTFVNWADAGAPRGSADDAPPPRTFPDGWEIEPDIIVDVPPFDVPAHGIMEWTTVIMPSGFSHDTWADLDRGPPQRAERGASPLLRHPSASGERCVSHAGCECHPAGPTRVFVTYASAPTTGTSPETFRIPAHEPHYESAFEATVMHDAELVWMLPHMHLRGKDMTWTVRYPDGRKEVVLYNDRFDYRWQIGYEPAEPIALPKGSTLYVVGHHDNSAANRFNPNPDKDVYYGDQAWEEMMSPWFGLAVARDVDPQSLLELATPERGVGARILRSGGEPSSPRHRDGRRRMIST